MLCNADTDVHDVFQVHVHMYRFCELASYSHDVARLACPACKSSHHTMEMHCKLYSFRRKCALLVSCPCLEIDMYGCALSLFWLNHEYGIDNNEVSLTRTCTCIMNHFVCLWSFGREDPANRKVLSHLYLNHY